MNSMAWNEGQKGLRGKGKAGKKLIERKKDVSKEGKCDV